MESIKHKTNVQPTEVALIPDALLNVKTVSSLIGLQRSSIYQRVKQGAFPQPIRMGTRCTRWRAGDVMAWLQAQAGTQQTAAQAA